jgi:hypothetical protein
MGKLTELRANVQEAEEHADDGWTDEVPSCKLDLAEARLALAKEELEHYIETITDIFSNAESVKFIVEGGGRSIQNDLRAIIARVWGEELGK